MANRCTASPTPNRHRRDVQAIAEKIVQPVRARRGQARIYLGPHRAALYGAHSDPRSQASEGEGGGLDQGSDE